MKFVRVVSISPIMRNPFPEQIKIVDKCKFVCPAGRLKPSVQPEDPAETLPLIVGMGPETIMDFSYCLRALKTRPKSLLVSNECLRNEALAVGDTKENAYLLPLGLREPQSLLLNLN